MPGPALSSRTPGGSRVTAYLEGGPQLAAKFNAMDKKIRNEVGKAALTAAGQIIAAAWSERVPIGQPPVDPHPGAYQRSLKQPDAVKVRAGKYGALGSVRPGFVDGIDAGDQPAVYAARLEFVDGEPSARPAFDSSKEAAVKAAQAELVKALV